MDSLKFGTLLSCIVFASVSMAGTPKRIKYIEEIITSRDSIYAHYKVTCDNGKSADISSWKDGKKWCAGKGKQDVCAKKKVSIARKVCR